MALNTNKDLKQYYSINEVATHFNVSESLLRFWEKEFPQLKPHKAGRNIRQYTKEDMDIVGIIYNLVKVRGIKIASAREMLKKNKEGQQNLTQAIDKLQALKAELMEMRKALNLVYPE